MKLRFDSVVTVHYHSVQLFVIEQFTKVQEVSDGING